MLFENFCSLKKPHFDGGKLPPYSHCCDVCRRPEGRPAAASMTGSNRIVQFSKPECVIIAMERALCVPGETLDTLTVLPPILETEKKYVPSLPLISRNKNVPHMEDLNRSLS
jgi:hypothetical protein